MITSERITGSVFTRRAYAKLNLLLSVGAPHPAEHPRAGFHPICSWFHCCGLWDDVRVTPLEARGAAHVPAETTVRVAWASDAPVQSAINWPEDAELATRAHRALETHAGRALPVSIEIAKRIPVGGGLGGGSSDAAAVLLALRELFALEIEDGELAQLGASLGADVPFFLDTSAAPDAPPRPAIVSGLGETIERTDALRDGVMLLMPGIVCGTASVYHAFDTLLAQAQSERRLRLAGQAGTEPTWAPHETLVRGRVDRMLRKGRLDEDCLMNDLAKPAYQVRPALGTLATNLSRALRRSVHVSGSGSTLYVALPRDRVGVLIEKIRDVLATAAPSTAVLETSLA